MVRDKEIHTLTSFQPLEFTQAVQQMLRLSRRTYRYVVTLAMAGLIGISNPAISGFTAAINLADLDGSNGFVLNGIDAGDNSGVSVASGDVNGDGLGDVIIGARGAPLVVNSLGESYVVFGRQAGFPATTNLADLDGQNGFVINGIDVDDSLGVSIASAGDINGDGLDDVIIGAPAANESYVVFGRQSGFPATLSLASLNGLNGFTLRGIEGIYAGHSVAAAGDVNGDGVADVIIGAYYAHDSYIVFGRQSGFPTVLNLTDLDGSNGSVLKLAGGISQSVAAAGDINGDGLGDVIIGTPTADANGLDKAGKSYVVFGRQTEFPATFKLTDLNGINGFVINGIDANDFSGWSVAAAGDVNGDGVDDVVIGAPTADPNGNDKAGESYVVFGRQAGFPPAINLANLDGRDGFLLNGAAVGGWSGGSVTAADVNGDGLGDIIIGAESASPNGTSGAGESYVVFGRQSEFPAALNLADLDGRNGYVLNGIDADDLSGISVSAGDVSGDGVDDVIIGAWFADPNSNIDAGESYVVFGTKVEACEGDFDNDGDLDGSDLLIFGVEFGLMHCAACQADFDNDGDVDGNDLNVLNGDFGRTDCPLR